MEETRVLSLPPAPDAIELRHLRAFVAVAEELNFSRAATRLYVSQPALSRQIRALERLVGCDLLRRSTHRVELTVAGAALLDRSRRLLGDLDDAVAATRSIGGEMAGRLAQLWQPFLDVGAAASDLAAVRTAFEELHARFGPPDGVTVAATNAGGVPALRLSPPDPAEGQLLYLHGGGYVAGSAFGYRHLAGALAVAASMPVLVPDYRLAPEHPFPAALEDALRAYTALLDAGTDPSRIQVAGDSAGAGLALSLLLALGQRKIAAPAAALLLGPWVDLTNVPVEAGPDAREALRSVERYLAGADPSDPLLDPLRADLSGLPPTLVQVGTGDPVLTDSRALVDRAQEYGVEATLELYPVPTHAFHLFWSFLPEAADAVARAGAFAAAVDQRAGRAAPAG